MITNRSQEKELIDLGPDFYSQQEYTDCLRKLFRVNRWFGFFRSTRKLLANFPKASSLLDIGCGGGLFILNLSKFYPEVQMFGVDINEQAIVEAKQELDIWQKKSLAMRVSFIHQPHPDKILNQEFDLISATLLCHHLGDEELIQFLQETLQKARYAVIINDLHRHWLSQKLYAMFSRILFNNRLISHDGLISIRRGFTRDEWILLLKKANIEHYQLKWCLPFRWQIVIRQTELSSAYL
jgi:2-polyprenyl-3-methyl-5-hydroxy-6-metoxy-1,4-benzoquinol methylase